MWFAGYARSHRGQTGGANYAASGSRSVQRVAPAIKRATILRASYDQWNPGDGWVAYCDPPYAGTATYSDAAVGFDSKHFWETMDRWTDQGAHVFVSEYNGPPHWRVIGVAEHSCNIVGGMNEPRLEKLFTRVGAAPVRKVFDMHRFERTGISL